MLPKYLYHSENTPHGWEEIVRDFVEEQARDSKRFWKDQEGFEFLTPLSPNDAPEPEKFATHAKQYSSALWQWTEEKTPEKILDWALGRVDLPDWPNCPTGERLSYPLKRRIAVEWWNWRTGETPSPSTFRRNAYMFAARIPFFQLAAGIRDFDLLELLVKPSAARERKGPVIGVDFYLMQYWMAWSIWSWKVADIPHKLNRRLDTSKADSTIREAIKKAGLRPQ